MFRAVKSALALPFAFLLGLAACSGDTDPLPTDAGTTADTGVAACDAARPCPTGQRCEAGACVPDNTPACSDTMPCGDGRTCSAEGLCVPLACSGHPICGDWVCINGACAEPPSCAGAACPGDLVCNPTTMTCEAPGVVTCTDDTECTNNQVCAGGTCVPRVTCAFTADCPNGLYCVRGVCDDGCTQASDCGDQALQWACNGGDCQQRCLNDDNCGTGGICEGNLCLPAECTSDAECPGASRTCEGEEVGHGRCVDVVACTPGGNECGPNFECANGTCVESPACRGDRDCAADRYCEDRHCQVAESCVSMSCPSGFECIGARCVPSGCRGSCPNAGEVCVGGVCQAPTAPSNVAEVRILTPAGAIRQGQDYQFLAIALDAAGNQIPGVVFDWQSSNINIAQIGSTGLAQGRNQTGTAEITASTGTGANLVTSDPVELTVLPPTVDDVRVTVRSGIDGAPLSATVVCDGDTQSTDGQGVALFTLTPPMTCTAYAANHGYVTVVEINSTDVMLRLPPLGATNRASGFQGQIDFSGVPAGSPVTLSFSGGSFSTPLWGFQPLDILGGDNFTVDLPVVGAIQIPSGATAAASFMGFPVTIKDTYYAQCRAGLRRGWTFAGTAELGDLGIGGGGGGTGNLLANVLPLLQTFYHGTENRNRTLADLPFVVDANDIDGDTNTTEETPDYASFVGAPMTPAAPQSLRVQLDFGPDGPMNADALFVTSGVVLPRLGFVPLGLDGQGTPSSTLGSFTTALAPPYAGLEGGDYAVMAAAQIAGGGLSAKLSVTSTLPASVDLTGPWLLPPVGLYDTGTRTLTAQTGAELWRAVFRTTEGSWHVYAPAGTTNFVLPTPPSGFADRTDAGPISLEGINLQPGEIWHALFAPNLSATGAERVTRAFASGPIR